ncbi:Uncharacterised protein [Sphingobacterium spiritivorum]|uniref:Uncharacterized protein n=1 Tax=Sphingobacterium spiritivorum TaxID=258 RepID=A0A380CA87_SPHSI|nr:hypothetical protein [Sphingobacterium spiritivorum]SUJ16224.1 Uncharacterised protein [Sphingobacterium spiritivorum]
MTAQTSEEFIYKGRTYQGIYSEPLRQYLYTKGAQDDFVGICSANWRGYSGTWLIENNRLYLKDFSGGIRYKLDPTDKSAFAKSEIRFVGLSYLFPYQKMGFADWYTGEITLVPEIVGTTDDYFNNEVIYRKITRLTFENGILINERIEHNPLSFRQRVPEYILEFYCIFFKHNGEDEINDDMFLNGQETSTVKKSKIKTKLSDIPWLILILLVRVIVFPFALVHLLMVCIAHPLDTVYFKSLKFLSNKFHI